ncbi:S8 family serine peptidase [Calditrichota bacterium GD2]
MKLKGIFLLLLLIGLSQASDWSFLNVNRIGAKQFIEKNPENNGKDVVVIILDTGVDMGVPGLDALPDGGVKVIDAQDFSGEGDVFYDEAEFGQENNEKFLSAPDGLRLFNYDRLALQPVDSIYYIGVLDEERFKNTVIPDVNNNGKQNDKFGFVVLKSKEGWVAYIDLDGDGNLDDEQPVWNYKEKHQALQFRGRDEKLNKNLATFAVNIFPDEQRINFHYDGSSHGTHVAGIAAGYRLNGQKGLNGIAPGAKIISLKIGDCTLAGGATTTGSMLDAYEYGVEFAKNYDGPVVFNMSFGIGSEIEGHASMESMLDRLLMENEKLLFCISAGNEGPGISSVGLPAAANYVLSVGALNTRESARDVYGAKLDADKVFVFSSRGGELNKPDILTPGSASSTVPPYSNRENKWGTSMASPQAAGAVALLMSAAYHDGLPIIGALFKKAIINAARPLKDYTILDQGAGVIDIPGAYNFYKKYVKREEQKNYVYYRIETLNPMDEDNTARAAYWRLGSYLPDKHHKQVFSIYPEFREGWTADQRTNFYRAFDLRATEPWIKLNQKSTYIKGEKAARIEVYFDQRQLNKPGLYTGKIIAYRKEWSNKAMNKEFELWCTYVNPLIANEQNHYALKSELVKIKPGNVQRIFFDVPVRATAMTIQLFTEGSKYANIRAYLFDPQGREVEQYTRLSSEFESQEIIRLSGDELEYGIYELDLYADFRSEEPSYCTYLISFAGLEVSPNPIRYLTLRNGEDARGRVSVFNYFDRPVLCQIDGEISGWSQTSYIDDESELYQKDFTIGPEVEKVEFEIELPAEIFNLMTDFAINIKNYEGKTLKADGLTYRKKKITFVPPASGDYYMELIPAFASTMAQNWTATLKESYYLFSRLNIKGNREYFYPRVQKETSFYVDGNLPVAPDGFRLFGHLTLTSLDRYKFKVFVPIMLNASLR